MLIDTHAHLCDPVFEDDLDDVLARARAAEVGAVVAVSERVHGPRFIEVHRLGSFSPRSLDVDVVLDLMVHDLDIVLALDGSEPTQIEAVAAFMEEFARRHG